jgi:hypothetical protein
MEEKISETFVKIRTTKLHVAEHPILLALKWLGEIFLCSGPVFAANLVIYL